jgi:glycosyltransferase involved in cell wall biosynthesis
MKISVALCTFNGENFIRNQIDSILNQSLKVDEIVITDDGSTDNTLVILEEYKKNEPEIFHIYQNEINLKSNKNFEKTIALCTGDYIFLSDQDDIWRNNKVEKTLEVFNQNPTAEGVFSNAKLINHQGKLIYESFSLWDTFLFDESKMIKPINLFELLIANGNFITGATLCIKKEVKIFCFPFITSENFLHDEWLALILSKRKTLYYITDDLLLYRLHNSQQQGVRNIETIFKKDKKTLRQQNLILKLLNPVTFKDYKFLTNRYFAQYERFKNNNFNSSVIDDLINYITDKFVFYNIEMQKKHPIQYYFRKIKNEKKGRMQIIKQPKH